MKKLLLLFIIIAGLGKFTFSQDVSIALLKYKGGGDWYANPTSLPNLVEFCNQNIHTNIETDIPTVEVGSIELFNYPMVHMTGHGNVILSPEEADNLRKYLIAGGFLHISDNYGLDSYIRREMKKVFPEIDFVELPFSYPIYHQHFQFANGLPKIHAHDNKDAQGFGIIYEGRLVCFYDFECDLGDGWEDAAVHNDSQEKRTEALQMGANIVEYVFNQ